MHLVRLLLAATEKMLLLTLKVVELACCESVPMQTKRLASYVSKYKINVLALCLSGVQLLGSHTCCAMCCSLTPLTPLQGGDCLLL